MGRSRSERIAAGALIALTAGALALRLWGVGFGLPYHYHPDERGHVLIAARMAQERTLRPESLVNPPLYAYLLLAADAAYAGLGLVSGAYASPAELTARLALDPTPLYLLGRVLSAAAGAATVAVAYALGRAGYNRRTGLLAAGLLAVAFLPVREAHFAVNDALLTLLCAVSLWGAVRVEQRGRLQDYVLAGAAGGLAFATKYTAALAVASLVVAHLLSPGVSLRPSGWKLGRLAAGLAAFVACALAGCPFFLLDPRGVVADMAAGGYNYGQQGFLGWQIDPVGGYLYYWKSLVWGLGPALLALCLAGAAWAVVRRSRVGAVLLTFPVLLLAFMGLQKMYFARFLLPAVPPLLVLGAAAADEAAGRLAKRVQGPGRRVAAPALLLAVVVAAGAQPLAASLRYDWLLAQTDTRTLAKDWIEGHVPEGARVAIDWPHHGPPLSSPQDPMPDSERTYDPWLVGGHGLADYSLAEYRARGIEYLVASSFISELRLADPQADARRRAFYASLGEQAELVWEVRPSAGTRPLPFVFDEIYGPAVSVWQRERPGPAIQVYRLAK